MFRGINLQIMCGVRILQREKWKNNYFFINVTCIPHDVEYWTDSPVYNLYYNLINDKLYYIKAMILIMCILYRVVYSKVSFW